MGLTKKRLDEIAVEEYKKFKKAITLVNEYNSIQKQLDEVRAGDIMSNVGVHAGQHKPEFEHLNSTTIKEDGEDEGNTEMSPMGAMENAELEPEKEETIEVNKSDLEDALKDIASIFDLDLSTLTSDDLEEVPGEEKETETVVDGPEGEKDAQVIDFESDETPSDEQHDEDKDEAEESKEDKTEGDLDEKKTNPYAVCNASVGEKDKEKFDKCVSKVETEDKKECAEKGMMSEERKRMYVLAGIKK